MHLSRVYATPRPPSSKVMNCTTTSVSEIAPAVATYALSSWLLPKVCWSMPHCMPQLNNWMHSTRSHLRGLAGMAH